MYAIRSYYEVAPQQLPARGAVVRVAAARAAIELHDQHHRDHDQGEYPVEPGAVEPHPQQRTRQGAGNGAGGQAEAETEVAGPAAEKGDDCRQVLSYNFV